MTGRLICSGALTVAVLSAAAGGEPSAGRVAQECGASDADPWIVETAERVNQYDGLLRFAIEAAGDPVTCEGTVTADFDGRSFGVIVFGFEDGTSFEFETMPPEISLVTLRAPEGFRDPEEVLAALRSYAAGRGLSIDWGTPERSEDGHEVTEQFWDPAPGLNASASVIRTGGVLVAVRIALAP